jgi:hypothetical protein
MRKRLLIWSLVGLLGAPLLLMAVTKIRLGTITYTGGQGNSGIIQNAGTVGGSAGVTLCTDASGNTTTVGCAATPVAVFANQATSALSVAASTPTALATKTVTMPASGCPCRVFISWAVWTTSVSSGTGYDFWVSDGSVTHAGYSTGQSNGAGASTGAAAAAFTTVTYANSAAVTFTLMVEGDHSVIIQAGHIAAGGTPPAWAMQLAVFPSN